jgi:hypothetical protein
MKAAVRKRRRKNNQILTVKRKRRLEPRKRRKVLIRSSNKWYFQRMGISNRQVQSWMRVTQRRIKGSPGLKY